MVMMKYNLFICFLLLCFSNCQTPVDRDNAVKEDFEEFRPTHHFSPKSGWMNDPNGMVYLDGEYHLFFQHNPDTTVWGPMHWGHAISKDMITWEEQPIALFPDSLGTIFSGSIIIDKDNSAGFGANAMVAIFTHHNHEIESKKTGLHQYQSLAYSIDKGNTWTKYEGNPVLPNPGIWDYRDPKVMWHEGSKQWIMTLATKQTITFYGSKNLKEWTRLSEFGEGIGAHGGVWECPDLIKFSTSDGDKWVLLVSINPGGPNTGSATQYFVGDFDGTKFTTTQRDIKWMDHGPDNYAGVTFSNIPNRNILIGWMSNWAYAGVVPASTWRSGMTIARELSLLKNNDDWVLSSTPVKELDKYLTAASAIDKETSQGDTIVFDIYDLEGTFSTQLSKIETANFQLTLSNEAGDELLIGFDQKNNNYYIDRSKAGNTSFSDSFIGRSITPRISVDREQELYLLFDRNSVELFADGGISNLSALFFVNKPFNNLKIVGDNIKPESVIIKNIK